MNENKVFFIDTENRKHRWKHDIGTALLCLLFIAAVAAICILS